MVVILLLFFTLTCVCGLPQVPLYQAEEDHNTTLRWDSPNKMDLSSLMMTCVFNAKKTLFEMIRGVEKSQDEQFSGRVHCDREALKEGHIWLHMFRLKPEDSGSYLCDMATLSVKGEWTFLSTKHFQLNVTSKGGVTVTTDVDVPHVAAVTPTEDMNEEIKSRNHWSTVSVVIVVVVICGALLVHSQIKNICKVVKKHYVSEDNNKVSAENEEALLRAADDTRIQMEREEEKGT